MKYRPIIAPISVTQDAPIKTYMLLNRLFISTRKLFKSERRLSTARFNSSSLLSTCSYAPSSLLIRCSSAISIHFLQLSGASSMSTPLRRPAPYPLPWLWLTLHFQGVSAIGYPAGEVLLFRVSPHHHCKARTCYGERLPYWQGCPYRPSSSLRRHPLPLSTGHRFDHRG